MHSTMYVPPPTRLALPTLEDGLVEELYIFSIHAHLRMVAEARLFVMVIAAVCLC